MAALELNVLALIALLLAQPAPSGVKAMLDRVDAQEALNDRLEEHFDAVCGAIKSGRRVLGPQLTGVDAHPAPREITWASGCSLRALKISGEGDRRAVHLLWEIEGRDASGARVTERGEADGEVRKQAGKWRLSAFTDSTRETVRRAQARFVERSIEAGMVLPPRKGTLSSVDEFAAGLTVRDFDGDGRLDVVALDGPRAWLLRNVGPGLAFRRELLLEVTANLVITAAIAGDYDEDGDPDLVVTAFRDAPSWVFRNDAGKLVRAGRLLPKGQLHSGVASDLDGDGHLDLALLSYPLQQGMPENLLSAESGDPIAFLRGNGKLGFTPWPMPKGALTRRWSLAAMAADLLAEGRPQLYVANDYGLKDLWRFEGDGGVRNVADQVGLTDPGNGMSVDVGDLDGDGRLDVYTSNMFSKAGTRVLAAASTNPALLARMKKFAQGNTLYSSDGDGGFVERGVQLGVNRGLWAYGALMIDSDDDGRLELAVANGFVSRPIRKDL